MQPNKRVSQRSQFVDPAPCPQCGAELRYVNDLEGQRVTWCPTCGYLEEAAKEHLQEQAEAAAARLNAAMAFSPLKRLWYWLTGKK